MLIFFLFSTAESGLDIDSAKPSPKKKRRRMRRVIRDEDVEEERNAGMGEDGEISDAESEHARDDDVEVYDAEISRQRSMSFSRWITPMKSHDTQRNTCTKF